MKKTSWEIVLAGIFCLGIAIYVVSSRSDSKAETTYTAAQLSDSLRININDQDVKVLSLKNLENLQHLQELHKLKELEKLESMENLESLKSIANFLPGEIKNDFIEEINSAIKEYEDQEKVDVNVNFEKGIIAISNSDNIEPGTWTAISPGIFAYIKEFDVSSLEDASLTLPSGSITVIGTDETTGKLTIEASGQISTRNELQSKLNILNTSNSESARFNIEPSDRNNNENIHLQAILSLPRHIALQMKTAAGHIESKNFMGEQQYQTGGGHITLANLEGEIQATTAGGHIEVKDSKGELDLESMGGHIRTMNCSGESLMKTSGGNLEALNFDGEIIASTNGGNIEISLKNISGDTAAKTGAGSILIQVPSAGNADIDLYGSSVEIGSGLIFTGDKTAKFATGRLGEGGADIKVKTNYGKVILKKND